jgi:signal transduction histidine kinase
MRRALQLAESASQAKSDFLASMSHELRTPLAAIVGYMDLLDGEMVGPVLPVQKTYLGRVKTAARHLIAIIEEILTFSRIEAGKEAVHAEGCDVAALVREVAHLFEPLAQQKRLTLAVAVAEPAVTMHTDITKLRQILINLLGNAVKFTDTGAVDISLHLTGSHAVFRIHDTGPGIDAEDLDRIFDPFTQVDQRLTRSKGGTGLGLPVSRRLATLLGGDLVVESAIGSGTTFTLSLPLAVGTPAYADALSTTTLEHSMPAT